MPENVAWGLQALGRLIGVRKQLVLTDVQVNDYVRKLQGQALENTRVVRKEHVQSLEKKAVAKTIVPYPIRAVPAESTSCPKCGGEMVKRTNRKTGGTFWGCSKFSKCRGARKTA
ncbi:topoisomerase DNA-binding C4 zinc finger domain-containing protein [Sulfitobacter sp.]|uniref:topoisomerase DNA-binding C4 zinc finger domain-containing protein n=1 Tax=Sulfitobacter sp. TaxID=1903071 RepID=UPI003FCC4057